MPKNGCGRKVYGHQLDKEAFLLEPDKNHLEEIMRNAYKSTAEIVRKGIKGALRVRKNWTWKHSALQLLSRIDSLCGTTMEVNAQKGFGDVYGDATFLRRAEAWVKLFAEWYVDAAFIVKAIEQKHTEHNRHD